MLGVQIQSFETLEDKFSNFQIWECKLQFSLSQIDKSTKSVTFYLVWPN